MWEEIFLKIFVINLGFLYISVEVEESKKKESNLGEFREAKTR